MIKIFLKTYDIIKKFDRYGKKVEFTVNEQSEGKNFIGALVSILSLVISILLTKKSFLDYWNKRNPKLETIYSYDTTSTNFLPKYVYPNLTNKKGYWAGAMTDSLLKENDILPQVGDPDVTILTCL